MPGRSASTLDRRWHQRTQTHPTRDSPFSTAISSSYFTAVFSRCLRSNPSSSTIYCKERQSAVKNKPSERSARPRLPRRAASVTEKWTYILRLLIDLVIRASCHRVIGQSFNGSNAVDYLGAGLRFDTVLTFLALRSSLEVSVRETFSMLLSLK